MLYINGIKATRKDLERLSQDIKTGAARIIEVKRTKRGAVALTVEG